MVTPANSSKYVPFREPIDCTGTTSRIWDMKTGDCLSPKATKPIDCTDKTSRIWDMKTGDCIYHVSTPQATAYDLPDETLLHIFSTMAPKDIAMIRRTCKQFDELSQDDAIWKPIRFGKFAHVETGKDSPSHLNFCKNICTLSHRIKNKKYTEQTVDLSSPPLPPCNVGQTLIMDGRLFIPFDIGGLEIRDLKTGNLLHTILPPWVKIYQFSVLGDRLYIVAGIGPGPCLEEIDPCNLIGIGGCSVWDVKTGEYLSTIAIDQNTTHFAVDKDYLYAIQDDDSIDLWKTADHSFHVKLGTRGHPMGKAGGFFFTDAGGTVEVWSLQSGEIFDKINLGEKDSFESCAGAPHIIGNLVYIPSHSPSSSFRVAIRVYDIKSKKWVGALKGRTTASLDPTTFVKNRLYRSTRDTIEAWDLQSRKRLQIFQCPMEEIKEFEIVGNHLYILSRSGSDVLKNLRIWDIRTNECLDLISIGPHMEFLADGSHLITYGTGTDKITIRDYSPPQE